MIQPLSVINGQDTVVKKLTLPQHSLTQTLGYEPSINSQMFRKVHWFHLTFWKRVHNHEKRNIKYYCIYQTSHVKVKTEHSKEQLTDLHPSTKQSYRHHQMLVSHSNTSNNIDWLLHIQVWHDISLGIIKPIKGFSCIVTSFFDLNLIPMSSQKKQALHTWLNQGPYQLA